MNMQLTPSWRSRLFLRNWAPAGIRSRYVCSRAQSQSTGPYVDLDELIAIIARVRTASMSH